MTKRRAALAGAPSTSPPSFLSKRDVALLPCSFVACAAMLRDAVAWLLRSYAPTPALALALVMISAAAFMSHAAPMAAGATGSSCLDGLQLHRRGRLDRAMEIYLQGLQQNQEHPLPKGNALQIAPCFWGATLAFWAMARSRPDGAAGEWFDLAHRSALAHRRLLGEWDVGNVRQQQAATQQKLLTCNGARGLADVLVDDSDAMFHPRRVFPGSVVFVNAFLSDIFFTLHMPFIRSKFLLITGCSDDESPGEWAAVARDPRLVWWAAQNNAAASVAVGQLPIGLPNDYDDAELARALQLCQAPRAPGAAAPTVVLGIDENTHPERRGLTELFNRKGLVSEGGRVGWGEYMLRLCVAQLALAPEGNGLDTHRFWECAAVGCRPVVVASHPLLPFYMRAAQPLAFENWHAAAEALQGRHGRNASPPSPTPLPEILKVTCDL